MGRIVERCPNLETTMATRPFDTPRVVERLEGAGVPAEQARMHASVFADVLQQTISAEGECMAERFASKQETGAEFSQIEVSLEKLDAKIDTTAAELKSELVRWMVSVVVSVGVLQTALIAGLLLKIVH